MTERLYYNDPACREFSAVVTANLQHGGQPAVILDRTAFYPTSGGQPFDTGELHLSSGDVIPVLETVDLGDDIAHLVQSAISPGTSVRGVISWPRRFDHMQQHTGQHVLSAAFERVCEASTVSFHMGEDTSTIDLAREVTAEEIARAEDEANRVLWEDRPITIRFATAQEAAKLPLRKEPGRGGMLRLIEVPDFDLSACGGTHVATTGAIGLIAVLAAERFRGGSRLTFVCGGRALRSVRALRHAVAASTRLLSVSPAELPDAIERLQGDARDQRKALALARETLAVQEADRLTSDAAVSHGIRIVVRAMEGWDAAALKTMAAAAAGAGGDSSSPTIVGLLTAGTPFQVVIARSQGTNVDVSALLRQLTMRFGGKGGGKPELAQGGGLTGDLREIVWALTGFIEDAAARTPRA